MISFQIEKRMFYFDVKLKREIKDLNLMEKNLVEQKFLNYFQKLEFFLEALRQNKEEDKIDRLYEDAIKLYSKEKGIDFLMSLFINI